MARKEKENNPPPGASTLPGSKPAKPPKQPRAVWNTATVQILIETLLEQKAKGNQTDNASWKPEAWTACAEALAGTEAGDNGSGGPPKTAKMCTTRWVSEKADYIMVKSLQERSGWGWDNVGHVIVVDDNTCPAAKKWRTKPYPLYDDMSDLVDGGIATGTNSFVPGQDAPVIPEPNDADDDLDFPLDPQLHGEGSTFHPMPPEEPIYWPQSDEDEPEIIEPPKSQKRARAVSYSSPTRSASTGKRQHTDGHGRKPSAGRAMFAVSESLKEVANALSRDPGGPSSLQRKTQAIEAIKRMQLDVADKICALQLIWADTSVADVLLALDNDDDMREQFLLAEIHGNTQD
ncbi:hypothetical protein B0H17DRAFT_1211595 [Mycena rosella]|uniref:Myb/SANT-like domain-containing protein n=1 Tax=Mycena rosella TaxID=1033263 RepID=A0AAD7CU56_MYCRO|nr:hypothetical protein B0H17DRAFT_1211595 [Mycena rosella]